jgi:hypothetical protein
MMYLEAFEIAEKEAAKGKSALICKDGDRFYVNMTDQLSLTSIGHGSIRLHPDGRVDPLTDEAKGFARDLEPVHNSVQAEDVFAKGC